MLTAQGRTTKNTLVTVALHRLKQKDKVGQDNEGRWFFGSTALADFDDDISSSARNLENLLCAVEGLHECSARHVRDQVWSKFLGLAHRPGMLENRKETPRNTQGRRTRASSGTDVR